MKINNKEDFNKENVFGLGEENTGTFIMRKAAADSF